MNMKGEPKHPNIFIFFYFTDLTPTLTFATNNSFIACKYKY